MRIAIHDSFPNSPITAEKEFIRRATIALARLGHEAIPVETSDDIMECRPDVVLVTHFFSPKLTSVPTIGLMWSPPSYYNRDERYYRNILSYDGYLSGAKQITRFLSDLLFAANKRAPISEFMYPSSMATSFHENRPANLSLFYAGVNWDNGRYRDLFRILDKRIRLNVFGPPNGWTYLKKSYRGALDVDGSTVPETIRMCGAALCIHRQEFRTANTPSSRLFEAAAAGAVIIGDEFDFTKEHFAGAMLFVDFEQSTPAIAKQIEEHLRWANAHPQEALQMAKCAHSIFLEQFCLEKLFANIHHLVDEVRRESFICADEVVRRLGNDAPMVQYVVRVGTRPLTMIERCLNSLACQTYRPIGVIIVQFSEVPGLSDLLESCKTQFASINLIRVEDCNTHRSNTLWKGLNAITAAFFGILDDDDSLHPNHVATLVERLLKGRPSGRLAYSGVIQTEDEHDLCRSNRASDSPSPGENLNERNLLRFLEPFSKLRLLRLENYITSNAWIAESELLDARVLSDPDLPVGEDLYLLLMLVQKTEFVPTWQPTAVNHFRSASKDNSVLQPQLWQDWKERIGLRTHLEFGRSLGDLKMDEEMVSPSRLIRGIRLFLKEKSLTKLVGRAFEMFRERGVAGVLEVLIKKSS